MGGWDNNLKINHTADEPGTRPVAKGKKKKGTKKGDSERPDEALTEKDKL